MHQTSGHTRMPARALGLIFDATLLTLLALIVVIAVTGGGVFHVGELRIRARSVENPIWIASALVLLRYTVRRWSPVLGRPHWPVPPLIDRARIFVLQWIPDTLVAWFTRPVRGLMVVAAVACIVKLLLAWTSPGFFSGDDVEVHEMSLAVLFGMDWPVWELRSAFFPMLVVYPAQRLAAAAGAVSPEALVFAGRASVAVLSTLAIPLTWVAARRLAPADARVAALAVMFLVINKLQMSFGSSELPRPVSTVFVVAAFFFVLRGGGLAAAGAGVLLGISAAFRFSEVVFLPAAVLSLGPERRALKAGVLLLSATMTLLAITAAADALYWGRPLASLAAMVDYTLVQRESSRGFEPPWQYLRIVPGWTTVLFVLLAVAGSSRRHADSWWTWTPLVLLSLLPHKESRYLLPIIPFFSIAVARGFLRASGWTRRAAEGIGCRRVAGDLFAPALLLAILHDVGGWRLGRSNEGIRLAQHLAESGAGGVAAQEIWRLGGRPYLRGHEPLMALPPELLNDSSTATTVANARWVALRSGTARRNGDAIMAPLGFVRDATWAGDDYVLYVRQK
ncbi:MAG: hypothetical protein M3541_12375 [Acidobacteriota bacterium]|nr:hypothetical protein [Acidobacteriota bacterium]MDQ3419555.1 hypothetical protein [Acidobacteriota bacterium]